MKTLKLGAPWLTLSAVVSALVVVALVVFHPDFERTRPTNAVYGQQKKSTPQQPKNESLDVKIEGEGVRTVIVVDKLPYFVVAERGGAWYVWDYPRIPGFKVIDNRTSQLTVIECPKGVHEIKVDALFIDFKADTTITKSKTVSVVVGDIKPGPGPDPKPPVPDGKGPIERDGMHVMIITERDDTLPPAQQAIIGSVKLRKYLREVCTTDPYKDFAEDNAAYRIWDDDVLSQYPETEKEQPIWAKALRLKRKSVPWIIISNFPHGGYEGPLPANVDETKALIQKYVK